MKEKLQFIKNLLRKKQPTVNEAPALEQPEPAGRDPELQKIIDAIAWAETRGVKTDPYMFSKFSGSKTQGDDIGKYQVTEGELRSYAQRYLGRDVGDINEYIKMFRSTPSAQEEYMEKKVQALLARGNTPQQVADIHRRGVKNSSPAGSNIYQDPAYVDIFNQIYLK
jgi:hypothetical protein